jgi:LPXTG-motif cell wall-anchored protein
MHLLFSLAASLFASSFSFATSFNIRPFSEFTSGASNIIRGTLSNIHTENALTDDGGKTIYTYANLAIKEVLKGNIPASNVTVRKLGGTKDGVTLEIPSSPEFVENEETVLFLSAEKEDHTYEVMGLELGKFGLEEKNGDMVLTGGIFNYSKPSAHDDHDFGEHAIQSGDLSENRKPWSLTQLRELIRKQNSSPSAVKAPSPVPQPNATVSAKTAGSPAVEPQPSESPNPTEPESNPSLYYWIGGLFLAAAAFFLLKRK